MSARLPAVLVTVTSWVPVPAGAVAVIEVPDFTVKVVAVVVPKSTADTAVNPVPVTVTEVPPAAGPAVGLIFVTVGATTTAV